MDRQDRQLFEDLALMLVLLYGVNWVDNHFNKRLERMIEELDRQEHRGKTWPDSPTRQR